jgi:hypothetical protein
LFFSVSYSTTTTTTIIATIASTSTSRTISTTSIANITSATNSSNLVVVLILSMLLLQLYFIGHPSSEIVYSLTISDFPAKPFYPLDPRAKIMVIAIHVP